MPPISYPRTPGIVPVPKELRLSPGEAVNAFPFEAEEILDFTTPTGAVSGVFYGIVFQLPKWGFKTVKVDEWLEVSPTFQQYHQITVAQKQQMENQIKQGLASIAQAVSDLDLVKHDMRRYREFKHYFARIDYGEELTKKGKKKDGEKLKAMGDETLKSIFIDQVDVHTGEGIAIKLIAPRWPTIIADFMKLSDEDTDKKKIMGKSELKGVSEPEAVVLATKNRLYLEWKKMFRQTVEERYATLVGMVHARTKSIEQYKDMIRPIVAKHRVMREKAPDASFLQTTAWYRPGIQAAAMDHIRIWAWKPFAPTDRYKVTREVLDDIPAKAAGFRRSEIDYIKKHLGAKYYEGKKQTRNIPNEQIDLFLSKGKLKGLPAEPSIDNVVRRMAKYIQRNYNVKFTPLDLFNARVELLEEFISAERGVTGGEAWVFSPYFLFVDIPMYRTVLHLPNGSEMEDLWIQPLVTATRTQNLVIAQYLEMIAMNRELDNYIAQLLGEKGTILKEDEPIEIEEIIKKELEKEGLKEKGEKEELKLPLTTEEKSGLLQFFDKINNKVLSKLWIGPLQFFSSRGPYEWNINHRLAKIYQPEAGGTMKLMADYFRQSFGVPGIKV